MSKQRPEAAQIRSAFARAAGPIALLLLLPRCVDASLLTYGASGPEVRRRFVEEAYCPAHRVQLRVIDPTLPAPPRAILDDPERLALWQADVDRRGRRPGVKRIVHAQGCGLKAQFTCWQDGRPPHRSRRGISYEPEATVCLLTAGSLDPFPPSPPEAPVASASASAGTAR